MNIQELIYKLSTYPLDTKVIIIWEGTEHEIDAKCFWFEKNTLWIDGDEGRNSAGYQR